MFVIMVALRFLFYFVFLEVELKRLFFFLVAVVCLWVVYIFKGVYDSEWALELVGGEEVLDAHGEIFDSDKVFMRSIKIKPGRDDISAVDEVVLCADISLECVDGAMSKTNVASIVTGDGGSSRNLLDSYIKEKGYVELGCPIKHETSRLISEVADLLGDDDRKGRSLALIEKIRSNGGVDYQVNIESCRKLFSDRPYLARAYLYHLSILMNIAYGKLYPGWVYLYYKSGFYRE